MFCDSSSSAGQQAIERRDCPEYDQGNNRSRLTISEGRFSVSFDAKVNIFNLAKNAAASVDQAANRVGKTEGAGGYELTCHLTGEYRCRKRIAPECPLQTTPPLAHKHRGPRLIGSLCSQLFVVGTFFF